MRRIIGLAALLLSAATPVFAGPFVKVGDRGLRQDIELLKAAGLIAGPIDSWPLAWAQIDKGLDAARDGRPLPPHVLAAVDRVERLSDLAQQRVSVDARLNLTSAPALARDFQTTAREKVDGAAEVDFTSGALSIDLGVAYARGQRGRDIDFSPSQAAVTLGNWAIYGGYTQQWFGPGQDGALLFSNNARPFPKGGIKRLVPERIDLPVLRWLGPLSFDIFAGALDEPRDHRNTIVVGTRLSFEPVRGLTFGFNRMQQLCGDGRPCGSSQIVHSFIGFGNADNPPSNDPVAVSNQPGNQIAGFDISYARMFGKVAGKIYFETEAEDSQHIVIEQFARLLGTTWSGPIGEQGANWRFNLEYADTLAAEFFASVPLLKRLGDRNYPGSLYNNGIYPSGFTYNGRTIGYWTDGDSRNLAGTLTVTDAYNRRWYGSLRKVELNVTGLPYHRVSANFEKLAILTGGFEWPTRFGDVRAEARYQTDRPDTPGRRDGQAQIEVGFRERF